MKKDYSKYELLFDSLKQVAINVYSYGSRVYGVHNPASDHDYIMVVPDWAHVDGFARIEEQFCEPESKINVKLFTESQWQAELDRQYISAIESYFLPPKMIVKKTKKFDYAVDLPKLRSSLSERTSISFVKAKKKFGDGEFYTGKKSLWHSLRILMYGIQIATFGRITDYQCANCLYEDIVLNPCNDWKYYQKRYNPMYNALKTEFRKVAPKEIN